MEIETTMFGIGGIIVGWFSSGEKEIQCLSLLMLPSSVVAGVCSDGKLGSGMGALSSVKNRVGREVLE